VVGFVHIGQWYAVARQPEHAGERVQRQAAAECRQDQRFHPEPRLDTGPDRVEVRRRQRRAGRLHRALRHHLDARCDRRHVPADQLQDAVRPLVVDQPHIAAGDRDVRDHRAVLAVVRAAERVDGERGPRREPLVEPAVYRNIQSGHVQVGQNIGQVDRQPIEHRLFVHSERSDVVVEAVDEHPAVRRLHRGEQVDQLPRRVGRHPAPVARVRGIARTTGTQLELQDPAHAEAHASSSALGHRPVTPHHQVGVQQLPVPLREPGQVRAAHLLLAVEQHGDRTR